MQNDLISRSALLEALEKEEKECEDCMIMPSWYSALSIIKKQPVAYNVEKVMTEMNKYPHGYLNVETIYDLTEIVRNGGNE